MTWIDCMRQEKKEKEGSLVFRVAKIHQYKDLGTTLKRAKKDKSQQTVTTMGTEVER